MSHDIALVEIQGQAGEVFVSLPRKSVHSARFCQTAGYIEPTNTSARTRYTELQVLRLHVLRAEGCSGLMADTLMKNDASDEDIKVMLKNKLCCQTYYGNGSIYKGESGSPLVCDGELQGVANLLIQQHTATSIFYTSIFAEVPYYTDWIDSVFRKSGEKGIPEDFYRATASPHAKNIFPLLFCTFFINILMKIINEVLAVRISDF